MSRKKIERMLNDMSLIQYNCEVQRKNSGADPGRARFHAAALDSRLLKSGQDLIIRY